MSRAESEATLRASVLVVAWRRDLDLGSCLDAIFDQTLARDQYEVVVIDNGGNPLTHASHGDRVDAWLETGSNLGCSGGRNYGAARANADVLVFVDDDGIIARNFLSTALDVVLASEEVAGVRGRVIAKNHPLLTMMSGVYDLGPEPYQRVILDCEGCSAVRREVFLATGGFDERLAGGEGLDWTVRMMKRFPGLRVAYEPSLVMRHDYVDSLRRFLSKAHMNSKARRRRDADVENFPNLSPPSGTFQFDYVPDRRSFGTRSVSRLGDLVLRCAAFVPEIKVDVRK